jgi:hypothetical protein
MGTVERTFVALAGHPAFIPVPEGRKSQPDVYIIHKRLHDVHA